MKKVDAVILAGGSAEAIDPALRFKGLVPVNGCPMVEFVIDAMREAKSVDRIIVTAPTAEELGPWVDKADLLVVTDGTFSENAIAGIDACGGTNHILVSTGDLPALTGETIDDFVSKSLASGGDFTYPLIPEAAVMDQYPGSQRTFFRLEEGRFTGGNAMLLSPDHARHMRDTAQQIFDLRKSPAKIAKFASIFFLIKFARGKMTIPDIEMKATQILEGRCVAIVTEYAAIGADVDKLVDVGVAEAVLCQRELGMCRGVQESA